MTDKFKLSLFKHKRDTVPQLVERSWQQLCSNFRKPQIRQEKDGLLFSPAVFDPAQRKKENVRQISLLVLDIDHNAELEKVKRQLIALDSAFAVYSTHSHLRRTDTNPNAEPRFRVCLPLASAIPAKEFPALWQFVKSKTNLPIDESAKDASRMFYTPAIAEKDAPFIAEVKDGAFLDWRKLPFADVGAANGNGSKTNKTLVFEFHEDRHSELCRRIEAKAKNTGRGTFEMKCPAHNGKGETSLFYSPDTQTVKCLKGCDYFQILAAFGLPTEKLPSREHAEKKDVEFAETETRIKPFPVPNEKCFYGLAGDFVRLVEPHTEASRMALLAQFIVYFGNLIGRFAFYKVEGDRQYTNCFCVLVGKTASGRKGTSFGRVKEVFKGIDPQHETECLVSGLASGEGLLYHIRDAVIRDGKEGETVIDPGVTDKRLLVTEGEFANVLRVQGREGNTLSAFIRNLWDNGNARSLTKNSPLKATNAHVSIIGHITQTELLVTLCEVEAANGWANRFLFFAVERDKFLPFGSDIDEMEIGKIRSRIIEAIRFAQGIEQMNFSSEARQLWASVYRRLETSRFGYLAKITQRASPYVLRLSCIFALLDQCRQIELIHLETALAVWQYSEDSARYIFGERLDDQTAEKIQVALKEAGENGLTRTDIRNLFDRHISNDKLDAALQTLLENCLAEVRKEETKGRPKETWFDCVKSVKSVLSVQNDTEERPFNAFNAFNAFNVGETKTSDACDKCGLEMELTKDETALFCPFGCGSRPINK